MQAGFVQLVLPKFVFGLEQVYLGTGMIQQAFDAVDVIVVTVSEQDVADVEIQLRGAVDDFIDFPGGVDDGAASAGDILDQVDEILHGPQFHGVYFESGIRHVRLSRVNCDIIRRLFRMTAGFLREFYRQYHPFLKP